MPVYGVFSQTEIDILQKPEDTALSSVSVDTLALEYLALIRSIQPHGPYYLGGFSIGGVLAFEVAQRLRQAGEEIGLIILLDSMLPGRGFKHLLAGLRRRLRMIRRQGLKHLLHIYRVYHDQTAQRHEPGNRRNQTYAQIHACTRPEPCDLPALFLQAGDDASTAPAYGWKALLPGIDRGARPRETHGHHGSAQRRRIGLLGAHAHCRSQNREPSRRVDGQHPPSTRVTISTRCPRDIR